MNKKSKIYKILSCCLSFYLLIAIVPINALSTENNNIENETTIGNNSRTSEDKSLNSEIKLEEFPDKKIEIPKENIEIVEETNITDKNILDINNWKELSDIELNNVIENTTDAILSNFLKQLNDNDFKDIIKRDTCLNKIRQEMFFDENMNFLNEESKIFYEYLLSKNFNARSDTMFGNTTGYFYAAYRVNGIEQETAKITMRITNYNAWEWVDDYRGPIYSLTSNNASIFSISSKQPDTLPDGAGNYYVAETTIYHPNTPAHYNVESTSDNHSLPDHSDAIALGVVSNEHILSNYDCYFTLNVDTNGSGLTWWGEGQTGPGDTNPNNGTVRHTTAYVNFTPGWEKLTINPNGGIWNSSSSSQSFTQTCASTKSIPQPTRTGYTFNGWNLSTSASSHGSILGTTYTFEGTSRTANSAITTTLTAGWKLNTYPQVVNVRYQNTDGSFGNYTPIINKEYDHGSTVSWSRAADTTYRAASIASYTVTGAKTTNVDVYRNTHTVTVNKGTGIASVSGGGTYFYGQSCTINVTLLTGYRWSNWTGSSTLANQSNTFTVTGNKTYTANALINSSTLKVDPNAGTWNSSTSSQNFTQNYNTTKAISIPTRTGYTFTGWTRTNSYGTMSSLTAAATYTFGTTHNVTDAITASWRINQYPVTYIDVVDSTTGTELGRTTKQVNYNSSVRGNTLGSSTADNAYHNAYYYVSDTQATVTTSGATVYRIFKLRTKDITVTKIWNDNSNIYSTRPGNLKINVLQNGNLLKTLTFSSSNAVSGNPDKWQQITTGLQKYDSSGKEYLYTIKEDENNANLQYFYEDPVYDQPNLTVTNRATYIPIKPNEKPIYKISFVKNIINASNASATKIDFDKIALDINNIYNFNIILKQLNRTVINTGTELKEVYSGYSGKEYNGIITNKSGITINNIPPGKYEISEEAVNYFKFVDFMQLSSSSNKSKLIFENGKYYIEISGLTAINENINIKVTNKIDTIRTHDKNDNKNNKFKL